MMKGDCKIMRKDIPGNEGMASTSLPNYINISPSPVNQCTLSPSYNLDGDVNCARMVNAVAALSYDSSSSDNIFYNHEDAASNYSSSSSCNEKQHPLATPPELSSNPNTALPHFLSSYPPYIPYDASLTPPASYISIPTWPPSSFYHHPPLHPFLYPQNLMPPVATAQGTTSAAHTNPMMPPHHGATGAGNLLLPPHPHFHPLQHSPSAQDAHVEDPSGPANVKLVSSESLPLSPDSNPQNFTPTTSSSTIPPSYSCQQPQASSLSAGGISSFQIPQSHMVHRVVDETGLVQHYILSPQTPSFPMAFTLPTYHPHPTQFFPCSPFSMASGSPIFPQFCNPLNSSNTETPSSSPVSSSSNPASSSTLICSSNCESSTLLPSSPILSHPPYYLNATPNGPNTNQAFFNLQYPSLGHPPTTLHSSSSSVSDISCSVNTNNNNNNNPSSRAGTKKKKTFSRKSAVHHLHSNSNASGGNDSANHYHTYGASFTSTPITSSSVKSSMLKASDGGVLICNQDSPDHGIGESDTEASQSSISLVDSKSTAGLDLNGSLVSSHSTKSIEFLQDKEIVGVGNELGASEDIPHPHSFLYTSLSTLDSSILVNFLSDIRGVTVTRISSSSALVSWEQLSFDFKESEFLGHVNSNTPMCDEGKLVNPHEDNEDFVEKFCDKKSITTLPPYDQCQQLLSKIFKSEEDFEISAISKYLSYELCICVKNNSPYMLTYSGKDCQHEVSRLKPYTEYLTCARVVLASSYRGRFSNPTTFKTLADKPSRPFPPKVVLRTKNSILLKWLAPNNNGSKIISYHLQYRMHNFSLLHSIEKSASPSFHQSKLLHSSSPSNVKVECNSSLSTEDVGEGVVNGDDWISVYQGNLKQFKLTKLSPTKSYQIRLSAENECGLSAWTEAVTFQTLGDAPPKPNSPRLRASGSNFLEVVWNGRSCDDFFTLHLQDSSTPDFGFVPIYQGSQCVPYFIGNLKRNTVYHFKLKTSNSNGDSAWSQVVSFFTTPSKPLPPPNFSLESPASSNTALFNWEATKDDGGCPVYAYSLELKEANNDPSISYNSVYYGPKESAFITDLKANTLYQARLCCITQKVSANNKPPTLFYSDWTYVPVFLTSDSSSSLENNSQSTPINPLSPKALWTINSVHVIECNSDSVLLNWDVARSKNADVSADDEDMQFQIEVKALTGTSRKLTKLHTKSTSILLTSLSPASSYEVKVGVQGENGVVFHSKDIQCETLCNKSKTINSSLSSPTPSCLLPKPAPPKLTLKTFSSVEAELIQNSIPEHLSNFKLEMAECSQGMDNVDDASFKQVLLDEHAFYIYKAKRSSGTMNPQFILELCAYSKQKDLKENTTYLFRLSVITKSSQSDPSEVSKIKTKMRMTTKFSLVKPTFNSATLKWGHPPSLEEREKLLIHYILQVVNCGCAERCSNSKILKDLSLKEALHESSLLREEEEVGCESEIQNPNSSSSQLPSPDYENKSFIWHTIANLLPNNTYSIRLQSFERMNTSDTLGILMNEETVTATTLSLPPPASITSPLQLISHSHNWVKLRCCSISACLPPPSARTKANDSSEEQEGLCTHNKNFYQNDCNFVYHVYAAFSHAEHLNNPHQQNGAIPTDLVHLNFACVYSGTSNTFKIARNIKENTHYFFKVKISNDSGQSSFSSILHVKTLNSPPLRVKITSINPGSTICRVKWMSVKSSCDKPSNTSCSDGKSSAKPQRPSKRSPPATDEASNKAVYSVYLAKSFKQQHMSPRSAFHLVYTGSETQQEIKELSCDTTYNIKVLATQQNSVPTSSSVHTFCTKAASLTPPPDSSHPTPASPFALTTHALSLKNTRLFCLVSQVPRYLRLTTNPSKRFKGSGLHQSAVFGVIFFSIATFLFAFFIHFYFFSS